ncbi:MAG: hypothetical protein O3C21_09365 [Verrucomicrobia bacterium]|nr:hypothetical protein [Verrucomicrobiota bacterium]
MAVSNIAKALDPTTDERKREVLAPWRDLFAKLDRLYKLHLLLCPSSRIHEKESKVHPLAREIEAVYEHLSGDISFRYPDEIQTRELLHGLGQHLAGEEVDYSTMPKGAVWRGDPRAWIERLQIRVGGMHIETPEDTRANRTRAHEALLTHADRWRDGPFDFETLFQAELAAGADVMVEAYRKHLEKQHQYFSGDMSVLDDLVNAPLLASTLPTLLDLVERTGLGKTEALPVVLEFIASEAGRRAPFNWNSSLLITGLARKINAGQKTLNSGTLNDVIALSSVAPYADAIFTDDAMAGLLSESPIQERFVSRARIFSNRTWSAFLEYLDGLESAADPNLKEVIVGIYGEGWLGPYFGLVEYVQNRKRREGDGPVGEHE